MSERGKELVSAAICFALSVLFAINAVLGKIAFGVMSILDTRQLCAICFLAFALCGVVGLIGNRRLNNWINPRLEAYSQRREYVKTQRKAIRAELDLKYPSRVVVRESRKRFLYSVAGWIILFSPLIAIIISIILIILFKTEIYYMLLMISLLYAVQLWGLVLRTFLQLAGKE